MQTRCNGKFLIIRRTGEINLKRQRGQLTPDFTYCAKESWLYPGRHRNFPKKLRRRILTQT